MPKNNEAKSYAVAELQPDELNALKALVLEFVGKLQNIDNEIDTLKGDRKDVIESYKEKLDVKTLNSALKYVKIQSEVAHKDTFDCFVEVLTDPTA